MPKNMCIVILRVDRAVNNSDWNLWIYVYTFSFQNTKGEFYFDDTHPFLFHLGNIIPYKGIFLYMICNRRSRSLVDNRFLFCLASINRIFNRSNWRKLISPGVRFKSIFAFKISLISNGSYIAYFYSTMSNFPLTICADYDQRTSLFFFICPIPF